MHTLSQQQMNRVAEAVAAAESSTSAEVKVVVLRHCWVDIREKAKRLFYKHQLHRTKDRNAVMILLVLANREFLVYGDQGIHQRVGEEFWGSVRDTMLETFRSGDLTEGLCKGIACVGEQLARHFPRGDDDVNEISDEVVHED